MILLHCYYERGSDTRKKEKKWGRGTDLPGNKFPFCGLTTRSAAPQEEALVSFFPSSAKILPFSCGYLVPFVASGAN